MEFVLACKIDFVPGALSPPKEMTIVARPAGRGVFLAVPMSISPFHVRVSRRHGRRDRNFQRNPGRFWRQHDEAAAERPFHTDGWSILVATGPCNALIVIGAAPGVVR